MTYAHLNGYQTGGVINVTGGEIFHEIIAPFPPSPQAEVSNRRYAALPRNAFIATHPLEVYHHNQARRGGGLTNSG